MGAAVPAYLVARARRLGDEVVVLLYEAHEQGRRLGEREGQEAMRARAVELAHELVALFEGVRDVLTPAQIELFSRTYEWSPHPVVAAYFDAAAESLRRYLERLRTVRFASGPGQ